MKNIQIPENAETFKSELGTYWFDETGILKSLSNNTRRTLENTGRNFELVRKISGGQKVCHMVYLVNSPKPDKATLRYVAQELPGVYKAMAIISKSGLGKIVMNIIFRLNPPTIPMKTFADEDEAIEWLKGYL